MVKYGLKRLSGDTLSDLRQASVVCLTVFGSLSHVLPPTGDAKHLDCVCLCVSVCVKVVSMCCALRIVDTQKPKSVSLNNDAHVAGAVFPVDKATEAQDKKGPVRDWFLKGAFSVFTGSSCHVSGVFFGNEWPHNKQTDGRQRSGSSYELLVEHTDTS